ncbi:hypothetical protein QQS21_005999 [Conoideocrella luteorostrata]|uniref:Uncharacterized protein n=1 Tax=Conoideocrella luteorostrata TaxID=1105319 RepID=A0AAJ0FYE8_9HYPO|nr:hypothetical protein QQS21_005999 [Conoideocrella luteorostrata]
MSGPSAPYALFVTSDKIRVEHVNDVLHRTSEGNDGMFFLNIVHIPNSSSPYDCAPDRRTITEDGQERELPAEGTHPPVADSFASPFVGKTLEECARYLGATPANKDWNRQYFCVLGEDDREQDEVMLVRSFDQGAVHAFPCKTEETANKMFTAFSDNFEEKLQMYQKIAKSQGKRDRSVGVPYEFMDM